MKYLFDNFEFDSKSLILIKDQKAIDIRHNEAKLLALLLRSPEQVFSKENILADVWQEKVVSEQAVFQNISHLRSIFGNKAIKTYPKRGYQWQLKTYAMDHDVVNTEKNSLTATITKSTPEVRHTGLSKLSASHYLLLSLSILFTSFFIFNKATEDNFAPIVLSYLPIVDLEGKISIDLIDDENFDFTELEYSNVQEFEVSLEVEYPKVKIQHPYILMVNFRSYQEQYFLDFLLKGPVALWQGQLSDMSKSALVKKLKSHLKQPFIYGLLGEKKPPEIMLANLTIAHQAAPNDLITLNELIDNYVKLNEFDKAMLLTEKLLAIASRQNSEQQIGNAYLFQSEILTQLELLDLSAEKLTLAIAQFEKINDLKRLADAWNAQSWLDHQNDNYQAVKISLLKSAQYAYQVNDKQRELHALTYLSVLAHKHHQDSDKFLYLRQAEDKMKQYELPMHYLAKIPFHYAIYADNPSAKEPHLKQVLAHSTMTPDHWLAQSSRLQLVKHYISQRRFDAAKEIIAGTESDNADNSYLKTLVAQATESTEVFTNQAQKSFEQAEFSGNKGLSLDIALLLCTTPNTPVNYDFYLQYIDDNATKYWRRNNESKLLALNL
jgi:DNA-binding winged helix-turn-helix (wHTH) protein